jgi:hypothetical protein
MTPSKPEPEPAKEPDGFVCANCGRAVFTMKLAPLCLRCRLFGGRPVRH